MRRKLIAFTVAFAIVAGGGCAEDRRHSDDKPADRCVVVNLKSKEPAAGASECPR